MKRSLAAAFVSSLVLAGGVGILFVPSACWAPAQRAEVRRVTHRAELIGGPRALGEVGDWLLENEKIRIIVQDQGFSRGFGVFGGGLIDADLVRPGVDSGDSSGGQGFDNFGEMFPAFFLEALEPSEVNDPNNQPGETERLPAIEIENDGSNGEAAVLVVRGYGNDFLALTQSINEALLDDSRELPRILFEQRYILEPGVPWLEIRTTVQNIAFDGSRLEWQGGQNLVGADVPTPFGDVMLFGGGNKVFMPHEAGFDLRYTLERLYQENAYTLPALPGLVGDFVASSSEHVSYGLVGSPQTAPENNYPMSTGQFPGSGPHSVHIPFIASAFTGVFQVVPPPLERNDRMPGGDDEYTFSRYFVVGSGDVASVSDQVWRILGVTTGRLSGDLTELVTHAPVSGAHVIVSKLSGAKITECRTDAQGRWKADLPAGTYTLRVRKSGRALTEPVEVTVGEGATTFQRLEIAAAARLVVTATEPGVGRVPAKVTLVGVSTEDSIGRDPKEWLYDLSMGEPWRFTDLVTDTEAADTRRYIETFSHGPRGQIVLDARPGTYTVFVSRGPEYNRVERPVTLRAGETASLEVELVRSVPTPGYLAADFHLHSRYSLDSDEPLDERLASYAGEGMELAVSTDHNFVVDYRPTLVHMGLERFMNSAIGLELTTIDRGHFNGFPLQLGSGQLGPERDGRYTNLIASRTYGSFEWALRTPQEVFDRLRALGIEKPVDPGCAVSEALTLPLDVISQERPFREDPLNPAGCPRELERVIVQANHPRDSILGYFEQYGVDQDSLEPSNAAGLFAPNVTYHPEFDASNYSWDFDAIEAFNGKRYEMLRNYVVPEGVGIDPVSCCPVTPGQVLRTFRRPFDCDPELRDCTCTPADTQAQVDAGSCEERGVAFPGVLDDWMAILGTGKRVVGVANSDSHEHSKEEPGYPRTYIRVPFDVPSQVGPNEIRQAFEQGDLLMTNGPFVEVRVGDVGMGGTVDVSGGATLEVTVKSARWVVPDRVRVYRSGQLLADEAIDAAMTSEEPTGYREATLSVDLLPGDDGFVVVEVSGSQDYFPVVFPNEIPPLQFTDVLGAIGGSFGLGGGGDELAPPLVYPTTPYAFTNPIWLDGDGDGEVTPSRPALEELRQRVIARRQGPDLDLPVLETREWQQDPLRHFEKLPLRKQRALVRMPKWLWPSRHPSDIRRVYWQFVPHAH